LSAVYVVRMWFEATGCDPGDTNRRSGDQQIRSFWRAPS
jgi:hypothetical protein